MLLRDTFALGASDCSRGLCRGNFLDVFFTSTVGASFRSGIRKLPGDAVADGDIQALIDTVNAGLPDYARIHRWYRLPERLAMSRDFYTENGRPRRAAILEHFSTIIDSLYAEPARLAAS